MCPHRLKTEAKTKLNTPGTAGGPGGRDRTLAVKSRKMSEKSPFFLEKIKFTPKNLFFFIYLLVMPKYWGGNYFAHGRFPEVGQKQKTEKEREKERAKVGDNNGQAMHGARKHAWRTQAAWAKTFNDK